MMVADMKEIIVSQLDAAGFYFCPAVSDESPMEPGVFLLPAGCVMHAPPKVPQGMRARWNGETFVLENIPVPEPELEAEVVPPTEDEIAAAVQQARRLAYMNEADPLFFKAQRGEATMDEWKAKVAGIRERYPAGVMP